MVESKAGGELPRQRKKLSTDDALALVLRGLKGEIPVFDLCRNGN
jgi:hypothetical protein